MGTKSLWEKLQTLQCHFNWCFELRDEMNIGHILNMVALKVEHTAYHNRGIYLAMRAYLQQLQGNYLEALDSLREAETRLQQDQPDNFSRQALLIYGNYAWIYYHLVNYQMVELYLGRISEICRSLSSPEPYSVQIPEIHAQKGWTLLALGFRKGEEATECFQTALREDESNPDFQAGLAISVFASWTHSFKSYLWEKARRLLEQILCRQPQNYEIKTHLADLLERKDWWRSMDLTMDVARNSLNPEDLRNAAKLCKNNLLPRAISILQRAIALAPGFHLLHYDLGVCYKAQLKGGAPEEREEILAAAIESFQRAVEANPQSIFSRLELAQLYSEKTLLYAEEMYQNLLEELPKASKRCQQAIYLHWGDFLLHRKGLRREALEMYEAGYLILSGHCKEWHLLRQRLMKMAKKFEEDSEMGGVEAVFETLRLRPEFQK
ncbi:PREDICTED: interferon-induced protein with tetratricopeptide repeats 5-like [Gekko japonicus]|uniref:Interferon-induced protein with tetratricopeptide repeats 5-like n=1 Tax=Gekko japonicus TaxID=146911 RepID=A0ABM1L6D1_GEKJA|nr:PREDICTED: interferon-induced protein with tetratricopeptide repeats 5-like [Gekko japonicus]